MAGPVTPRGAEIDPAAGLPFDAARLGRTLLRTTRSAALSTLDAGTGHPFGSVTNIATAHDGSPLLFMAGLALHTRNLAADSRAALTLAELGQADALAGPRLVLLGDILRVEPHDLDTARGRYLLRFPKAELYLSLPDAGLYRMQVNGVQLGGGPGRNASGIGWPDIATDLAGAEALIEAEAGALAHLNADHSEALRLYATRLCGAGEGRWRAIGVDPDGLDLAAASQSARLHFPERITDGLHLRQMLKRLADEARQAG